MSRRGTYDILFQHAYAYGVGDNCGIKNEAYIELFKERNRSLKCLHLEDATALFNSIKGNPSYEYLTLCQNLEELEISHGRDTFKSAIAGIN